MIRDIITVIWKEWRELIFRRGLSRREQLITAVMAAIVFVLLIRAAPLMASQPQAFAVPSLIMIQLLMAIVTDSFAGERERHTLETLLASRLSDTAILIGKIAAAVLL